jgi:Flp pilus assembly secretin CpaC
MGTLQAAVGSGVTVDWPEATTRIAVGNDTIARVNLLSRREAVITGLAPGRTTVFAWLTSGRRLFYRLVVEPNIDPARTALRALDPTLVLEPGPDGTSVILRGSVANEAAGRQARLLVEQMLPRATGSGEPMRLVSLLQYPGSMGTADDRLAAAMAAIDPRIRVRPIQAGPTPNPETDSYILEGRVRDVNALVQAVIVAERQLGGTGTTVKAADDERVRFERPDVGIGIGGGAGAGNGLQALQGATPPRSGISAQIARSLLITSESGRVVSFLEVDSLPQINVAIRVLEINRSKARRMGVNFRVDSEHLSIGSVTIPASQIPGAALRRGLLSGGNIVASYVSGTTAIAAALDFLSDRQLARSVAEPNILTLSGELASVLVGGEVPIPIAVTNQVSVQSGFSFQQFGVRMDIRPTVDAAGVVALEVAPSIVTPAPALGVGEVPGFRIQRVETTARVQAGQSLVLGGLLTSNESTQQRGVPGLQKLPIFRWERTAEENTELLFVITPRVVEPPSPEVRLPPLDFQRSPNYTGVSGLDEAGVPISFRAQAAKVTGNSTVCLEVREGPSIDAVPIDCLLPDTEVFILETAGEWHHIRIANGKVGWAPSGRLKVVADKP